MAAVAKPFTKSCDRPLFLNPIDQKTEEKKGSIQHATSVLEVPPHLAKAFANLPPTKGAVGRLTSEEIVRLHAVGKSVTRVDKPVCLDEKTYGIARKILAGPKGERIALLDKEGVFGTGSLKLVYPGVGLTDGKIYAVGVCDIQSVHKQRPDVPIEFLREICQTERGAANVIRSPNVVEMPLVVEDGDTFYFVMEHCSGGEFYDVLNAEVEKPGTAAPFRNRVEDCLEIAKALEALHSKNIVYRDLKPENILIDKDGHKKLSDFGFAVFANDPGRGKQNPGSRFYAAPERCRATTEQQRLDAMALSSDIWSLGIIFMNHLVLRRMPWQGLEDGKEATAMLLNLKPGCKFSFPEGTDPHVITLLSHMFQIEPGKRPNIKTIIQCLQYILAKYPPEKTA